MFFIIDVIQIIVIYLSFGSFFIALISDTNESFPFPALDFILSCLRKKSAACFRKNNYYPFFLNKWKRIILTSFLISTNNYFSKNIYHYCIINLLLFLFFCIALKEIILINCSDDETKSVEHKCSPRFPLLRSWKKNYNVHPELNPLVNAIRAICKKKLI